MDTERQGIQHPVVWVIVIASTLMVLFVLNHIAWLALPFVLAIVLYYVCSPAVDWLKKVGFTHTQAVYTFLVAVTFFILLTLPLGFKVAALAEKIPRNVAEVFSTSQSLPNEVIRMLDDTLHLTNASNLTDVINERMQELKKEFISKKLPDIVITVLEWLPSLLLVPYITFFFLRDGSSLKKLIMRGVPNAFFEKILLLFHKLDFQVKQYFRGLAMLTILNFFTIGIGLWLVGLPFGVFKFPTAMGLGLFCAFLAWVPYVGAVIGCITVMLVSMTAAPHNNTLLAAALGLFIIAKMLEDFLYTPMTVGQSLRMHPLLTVLMIFVGGYVGGIIGLLLAMPVLGSAMVLGEIIEEVWIDDRLRARYSYALRLKRDLAHKDLKY